MNLEKFIEMMQKNLEEFKLYWITENAKNPEIFPLSFDIDNDGIWFEMFEIFMSEKDFKMGLKLFGRCVLHDYTKWEVIKEDGYNRGYGDGEYRRIYERGIVYVQSCQCKECGFQKLKTNRVVLYN